jgi:hypothetical protein
MEFSYKYPGKYMFHAHKTEFAEKGWMGTFLVKDTVDESINENSINSSSLSTAGYSIQLNNTTGLKPTGGTE